MATAVSEHRDIIDIRLPEKREGPVEHEHPPPCSRSVITEVVVAICFLVAFVALVVVIY
jgi:hypothetical protein